jgi:hypothetical protein
MTYEMILYEGSNDIKFLYYDMNDAVCPSNYCNGGGATVGIENIDGSDGIQFCYNEPGKIYDGLAILFHYDPGVPIDGMWVVNYSGADLCDPNADVMGYVDAMNPKEPHSEPAKDGCGGGDPDFLGYPVFNGDIVQIEKCKHHNHPHKCWENTDPSSIPPPDWMVTDTQGTYTGIAPWPYDWHDITDPGLTWTDVGLNCDDCTTTVSMPFNFMFYGNTYNSMMVSSNGWLSFSSWGSSYLSNYSIPTTTDPDNIIAPFWDDLDMADLADGIYTTTIGTAPNRIFVVLYNYVYHYNSTSASNGPLTFEVLMYEGTNDIVIQYKTLQGTYGNGNSCTVGIENIDGTVGIEYTYNTIDKIYTGLAILFTLETFEVDLTPQAKFWAPGVRLTVEGVDACSNMATSECVEICPPSHKECIVSMTLKNPLDEEMDFYWFDFVSGYRTFEVNGFYGSIQTSCSRCLKVGDVFGDLEITCINAGEKMARRCGLPVETFETACHR